MDYILKGTIGAVGSVIGVSVLAAIAYRSIMRTAIAISAPPMARALNILFWALLGVGMLSAISFSLIVVLLTYYRTLDSSTTN